jgi:uncharacterized membrane protein YfcA
MPDAKLLFIVAVFTLAGLVKGVIGLGLPTISMGLLALVMTPLQAAAILVLPSFVTNVWQMFVGTKLLPIMRRLWPMMVGICLGTWAGIGLMSAVDVRYSDAFLGAALMVYAATGLAARSMSIQKTLELWLGPIAGAVTGLITSITGVSVIPSAPYLQAIGLEKEELVQALGLSFTVSMLALMINLAFAGALNVAVAGPALSALAAASAGLGIGQVLRSRLAPATFRRYFFGGLLLLGAYLVIGVFR